MGVRLVDKAHMRILILGGTSDAVTLAERLADQAGTAATLSLAGRTQRPRACAVPMRVGGFGGVEGLKAWLADNKTDCVIDATHPFAAIIPYNAAAACAELEIPLLALRRPQWPKEAGDDWIEVANMDDAAASLGETARSVFLTIGRQEVAAFSAAPQHRYLVRSIEPIDDALRLPHLICVLARGPFDEEAEMALMRQHEVEILVSKNSGGLATYGKIAAARRLGIPVVMVSRPDVPDVPSVRNVEDALAWIGTHRPPP
jgi:precorrin-6A/cobalt-precorrin-6A reductase